MKTSSKIFSSLLGLILLSTLLVDFSLKSAYLKIDLNDQLKNYEAVTLQPFKYLHIKGGNSYVIAISQSQQTDMKVMTSRKTFLTSTRHGDTLYIDFTVAGGPAGREPDKMPRGLLITAPAIREIMVDGSACIISNLKADSLKLTLHGDASAKLDRAEIIKLTATGNHKSVFNFGTMVRIGQFNLRLKNSAMAFFDDISYISFKPQLKDSSLLIFNPRSATNHFKY